VPSSSQLTITVAPTDVASRNFFMQILLSRILAPPKKYYRDVTKLLWPRWR